MTIPEWVAAANKILRENKSLSYKEAEEILVAAGHQRPKGIKQNGGRKTGRLFARASKKTPEQSIRRRNHEKTSTPEAAEHVAKTKLQRKEVEGIAEYAGLPGLHTEHLANQDSADAIRTGAAGDLVENIPADSAKSKNSLESIIRNDYNKEYVVAISADNFRIIPKESYDELVDPDDLPGFNINETKDLDSQLKKGIEKHRGGIRLQRRLARQFANGVGEIPLAGYLAGPAMGVLLGQSPAEAAADAVPIIGDLESDNNANVSREGQMFVDRTRNIVMPTPETIDQGKQGLAYKDGQPVAVPYGSIAGEATNGDMAKAFVDQVYEVNKKRLLHITGGAARFFLGN